MSTVYAMLPSTIGSSTPVTVTTCGVFQVAGVIVTLAGDTVPSVRSLDDSAITTSATGWLLSVMPNVALPPCSVVTRPAAGVARMPGVSLSLFVAETFAGSRPL